MQLNNIQFTLHVPVLDSITINGTNLPLTFNGSVSGSFVGNKFQAGNINFTNLPDPIALIKQAAHGVIDKFAAGNLPLLGGGSQDGGFLSNLTGKLDKLGNISVFDKLGLSGALGAVAPVAASAFDGKSTLTDLRNALGTSHFRVLPAYEDPAQAVLDLVNGKKVDLIGYTNTFEKQFTDSITISSPPIPLLISGST